MNAIPSKNNGTCAIKMKLGWCIVGPVNGARSRQGIHRKGIAVKPADTKDVGPKLVLKRMVLGKYLTRLYNQEFTEAGPTERESEASLPQEEKEFMKIL